MIIRQAILLVSASLFHLTSQTPIQARVSPLITKKSAFAPGLIYTRFFYSHKEIGDFLKDSDSREKINRSRWESWLVIVFQVSLFLLLGLKWKLWLTLFLIHGLLWSSQNYVNHAFSPRNIINGAHNLKIPLWLKFVYLNFNLHLAHHQNPKIPWIHFPRFIKRRKGRMSFFRNYIRL
jgi:fatty acid desaturase